MKKDFEPVSMPWPTRHIMQPAQKVFLTFVFLTFTFLTFTFLTFTFLIFTFLTFTFLTFTFLTFTFLTFTFSTFTFLTFTFLTFTFLTFTFLTFTFLTFVFLTFTFLTFCIFNFYIFNFYTFNFFISFTNGNRPLSYNITGESAPIFFQSKKCRQKHGGFQHLLTPYGSSGSGYLPLTNRDPTIKIKSFTPHKTLKTCTREIKH